ncbi:hypothetical protein A3844_30105 [Paenibacillus helianthi]|uniref:Uncharacterized protein n=1 Tax=Paenibacillus helianthi TaxID=1349432 RepID=A0ABX3EGF9_9BACL|nr:hypothetical protein [Paenibacillus helianthi]OKP76975.1 hypothetical protein A3844_30105 [Paenibacillus helianthi]
MTIKPMVIDDYFKYISSNVQQLFKELPEPLPWIEPSINMLYLNAALDFRQESGHKKIDLCGLFLLNFAANWTGER